MYSVAQRVIEWIASAAGVTEAPTQPGSVRTLICDLYQFPPADRTNTTVRKDSVVPWSSEAGELRNGRALGKLGRCARPPLPQAGRFHGTNESLPRFRRNSTGRRRVGSEQGQNSGRRVLPKRFRNMESDEKPNQINVVMPPITCVSRCRRNEGVRIVARPQFSAKRPKPVWRSVRFAGGASATPVAHLGGGS